MNNRLVSKRFFDFVIAFPLFILSLPVILSFALAIFLQDGHSPLYIAPRVGLNGRIFSMYKLRSMSFGSDRSGLFSTSKSDSRITPVGSLVRALKLDELVQLFNVIIGDMSLVGPRPNVLSEVENYTNSEMALLSVRPGITDFSSIVFSDEAEIIDPFTDADDAYNQLIRPSKSRLGLFYIQLKVDLWLDFRILIATVINAFARSFSLKYLLILLKKKRCSQDLLEIASRKNPLSPACPPGMDDLVGKPLYYKRADNH